MTVYTVSGYRENVPKGYKLEVVKTTHCVIWLEGQGYVEQVETAYRMVKR